MAPHDHTFADGPDVPRLAAIGDLLARGLDRLRRRGNPDGRAATSLDLQAGLSVTVPAAVEPRMKEAQR